MFCRHIYTLLSLTLSLPSYSLPLFSSSMSSLLLLYPSLPWFLPHVIFPLPEPLSLPSSLASSSPPFLPLSLSLFSSLASPPCLISLSTSLLLWLLPPIFHLLLCPCQLLPPFLLSSASLSPCFFSLASSFMLTLLLNLSLPFPLPFSLSCSRHLCPLPPPLSFSFSLFS